MLWFIAVLALLAVGVGVLNLLAVGTAIGKMEKIAEEVWRVQEEVVRSRQMAEKIYADMREEDKL